MKLVIDTENNTEELRELTAAEIKQETADAKANEAKIAEIEAQEAAQASALSKLSSLGLTDNELIAMGLKPISLA